MSSSSEFSGAPSALGYLFQCRVALLEAIKRLREAQVFGLRIEGLDDIEFAPEGSPSELIQTKHHVRRTGDLGDMSTDLWRTLRVWSVGTTSGDVPGDARLFLLTTGICAEGSAASKLGHTNRAAAEAHKLLLDALASSTNRENAAAYAAFRELGAKRQLELLERIVVVDGQAGIGDVGGRLAAELRFLAASEHVPRVVERLEGWWLGRVIGQLSDKDRSPIASEDLDAYLDDLREQFKRDALPVDEDVLAAAVDGTAFLNMVFVQQLRLANVGAGRVLNSIVDYYRAGTQRSRWLRQELVLVGEVAAYERLLTEEWRRVFERTADELGKEASEELKQKAAREVLNWAEDKVIPIRPNVTHPAMSRGSFHLLADELRIGWHQEFKARLANLLEGAS